MYVNVCLSNKKWINFNFQVILVSFKCFMIFMILVFRIWIFECWSHKSAEVRVGSFNDLIGFSSRFFGLREFSHSFRETSSDLRFPKIPTILKIQPNIPEIPFINLKSQESPHHPHPSSFHTRQSWTHYKISKKVSQEFKLMWF